ncbi:MAG: TM0106 family RecB-like putative nuclease [Myxococcales bacterium]|nr:MAG: TM0106 family RecB-like putative nuclease [Myxococcales bacterium]
MKTKPLPIIKPSDAKSWSLCARRVWLDNKAGLGLTKVENAFEQLIIDRGIRHERRVLDQLSQSLECRTAKSPEHTNELIAKRIPVIYQAQLNDEKNGIIGNPDFLILHESGEYQAADAKLSLNGAKKEIRAQLGLYRRMLGNGLPAIAFLGNGEEYLVEDSDDSVAEQFLADMRRILSSDEEPFVRYSHSKCSACPYCDYCKPKFEAAEDPSLLYGLNAKAALGLEKEGIGTISQLASSDPKNIPDIPHLKGFKKKQRAVLQAKAHLSGDSYQLRSITLPAGQWVHFDIEDNPLTDDGEKHVYLWGFLLPEGNKFEFVWTDNEEQDKQGWLEFLKRVDLYRSRYPNLNLAHYSHHEKTTIQKYAQRYEMEDQPTVSYLLGDQSPLFDLQKPILDALVLPLQGYGLKDICKHPNLVNYQWRDEDSGSQWSVVQFHRYLEETNIARRNQLKADILSYNQDDVTATHHLEQWLRKHYSA